VTAARIHDRLSDGAHDCLAAARHQVLGEAGWDVEPDGLQGAPTVRVIVGEKPHYTIDQGLRLLGLGAGTVSVVPPIRRAG